MLKNQCKTFLYVMGVAFSPLIAQADSAAPPVNQVPEFVPGEIVRTGQLPAAYNASAAYCCVDGWDVFVTADYIYWDWDQESSFQIGTIETKTQPAGGSGTRTDVFANPGYASGFQVGLGFNMPGMDNWNLYSEYTWYKNTENTSVTTPAGYAITDPSVSPGSALGGLVGTVDFDVELKYDSLDFLLKRPYYFGKRLSANFAAGLRALWITFEVTKTKSGLVGDDFDEPFFIHLNQNQTSWALGPKIGLETNWMLGYGFQIMANISASVLYASYNFSLDFTKTLNGASWHESGQLLHNHGTVRPITEAFLGLGWNTGFCDNNYRITLSAGYDFDVFWSQDLYVYTVAQQTGNMYLQGLNIQARFDF